MSLFLNKTKDFVFILDAFFLPDAVQRVRRTSQPIYTLEFNISDVAAEIIKVDYIGSNIFWVDNRPNRQGIYMANIRGEFKKRVIRSYVKIEGLAIDAERG